MIINKRLFFGLISSLLLAAGFARAADRFDPMTRSLGSPIAGYGAVDDSPGPSCAAPCEDANDSER
jgi:hypothetical protein